MITDSARSAIWRLFKNNNLCCRDIFEQLKAIHTDLIYNNVCDEEVAYLNYAKDLEISKREYLKSTRLIKYAENLLCLIDSNDIDLHDRLRLVGEYNRVINALA